MNKQYTPEVQQLFYFLLGLISYAIMLVSLSKPEGKIYNYKLVEFLKAYYPDLVYTTSGSILPCNEEGMKQAQEDYKNACNQYKLACKNGLITPIEQELVATYKLLSMGEVINKYVNNTKRDRYGILQNLEIGEDLYRMLIKFKSIEKSGLYSSNPVQK